MHIEYAGRFYGDRSFDNCLYFYTPVSIKKTIKRKKNRKIIIKNHKRVYSYYGG